MLEATFTSGQQVTQFRYSWSDHVLRIEDRRETGVAPPVNLLDLETGDLTIYLRHNATFLRVPAERLTAAEPGSPGSPGFPVIPPPDHPKPRPRIGPSFREAPVVPGNVDGGFGSALPARPRHAFPPRPEIPDLPPGIGPGADQAPRSISGPALPKTPGTPSASGPTIHPTGPPTRHPDMPALPALPQVMRAMTAGSGMPPITPRPVLPGKRAPLGPPELQATEETREICGIQCTKYTMTHPREGIFEIWATDALGPFFLLHHEAPRQRDRRDWQESWPSVLRTEGLFPVLARLTDESGKSEFLRFEVTAHDPDRQWAKADPFEVPPDYHEIEPLPF